MDTTKIKEITIKPQADFWDTCITFEDGSKFDTQSINLSEASNITKLLKNIDTADELRKSYSSKSKEECKKFVLYNNKLIPFDDVTEISVSNSLLGDPIYYCKHNGNY